MKRLAILLILAASACHSAPSEVWLTPERARRLKAISSRPYVTAQKRIDDGTVVYSWTNGARSWVTTQAVTRVTGKPAKNAWREKVAAAEADRAALLKEVGDLAGKSGTVKKSDLQAIIDKHANGKAK